MQVIRHFGRDAGRLGRSVLTLGTFDGLHLGHQAIVARLVERARHEGATAVAMTFHPHPLAVVAPERAPRLLLPFAERLRLLAAAGVDVVFAKRFSRSFSRLTPETFVRDFLLSRLEVAGMVVGYSVTFGCDRAGTAETLVELGGRYGFPVEVVGPVEVAGMRASSTVVRELVARGDVAAAARLLGRPYGLVGRVEEGERRGHQLGFPTANLRAPGCVLPANGVYAAVAHASGRHAAVVNIGHRPTFGGGRRTIEAHLIDFAGDLYGQRLRLELVARLRGEVAFGGPGDLAAQIAADVARARALLADEGVAARS